MRTKLVAANWKMHLDLSSALELTQALLDQIKDLPNPPNVILSPGFPLLSVVSDKIKPYSNFKLAAQNFHESVSGAFTGEVSADMLRSVGVTHVIIGHSERRQLFSEGEDRLTAKLHRALEAGLIPIFCIGESLSDREENKTFDRLSAQLEPGILNLSKEAFEKVIIAYEPVWAIGTGRTATPAQAQEVHAWIRQQFHTQYGATSAEDCTILYGGSVNASNASELFSCTDIDGGLVGGASLKANEFYQILKALPA
jgi:triosephosphate isomerase